jgi:monoamine oxidase
VVIGEWTDRRHTFDEFVRTFPSPVVTSITHPSHIVLAYSVQVLAISCRQRFEQLAFINYPMTSSSHHVIVIGAGASGLMAAQELLTQQRAGCADIDLRITIVEACSEIGGRVKGVRDLVEGHVVEMGAEICHGQGTVLTDLVERYTPRWAHHLQQRNGNQLPLYEDIFITSYADGGPSPVPTRNGKYGMYYCGGELMNYDDVRLHPLERLLGTMHELPCTETTSIQDVLADLPVHLQEMAVAGYGNTAGNTRLENTSLQMMLAFEEHWEETEGEGDTWLNSKISMSGVVQELYSDLQQHPNLEVMLSWKAAKVETSEDRIRILSTDGAVLCGDSVIVTMPPKYWSDILELPQEKEIARKFVGGEALMKVILKFRERPWPVGLQGLICADGLPIPELWFRELGDSHIAVCFLNSGFAEKLLELSKGDKNEATKIVVNQLSTVLSIPLPDLEFKYVETRMHVWDVGYMFPKVGLTPANMEEMAKPHGNVYFAGEGTHTKACCTVHAAMETGIRAAQQILEHLASPSESCNGRTVLKV